MRLLGDFSDGKNSFGRRFICDHFEDRHPNTNGTNGFRVSRKVVAVPKDDTMIELTIMLWDLADSKGFESARVS